MALWSRLFGGWKDAGTSPGQEERAAEEAPTDDVDDSRLSFLESIAEKLREGLPDLEFQRDVPAFALRAHSDDGREHAMFLDNLFAETRDLSPEAREERILRFVTVFATSVSAPSGPIGWEEAQERLVVCLRAATIASGLEAGERTLVRRPFLPMLLEIAALDAPGSIQYVGPRETEAWKAPPDELFAAGRARLASAETRLEAYDPEAPYALWFVANDDDYEASRLLIPGWLASLSARVNGRPVAIVPHTRLLIVGGDGDDGCVKRLVDVAWREYQSSSRSLSPALYTVDEVGTVVPFRSPPGHPLASDVERGHRALEHAEYGFQQKALQASAMARQDAAFVASYTLLKRNDGTFLSYATWPKTVPSLLPRVDRIALIAGLLGTDSIMVPWSAVVALDPPCLALEPDVYPPRYRTVRWPTAAELESLRSVASRDTAGGS